MQILGCHDYGQCLIPPELAESQAESQTDSRTPGLPSLRPPGKLDVKLVKQILSDVNYRLSTRPYLR